MRVSNINVTSVTMKLVNKVTSRHIKCQFMRVKNIAVINVIHILHNLIPLEEKNPMIPHTPLKYNFSLSLVGSLDLGLFFSRVDRI